MRQYRFGICPEFELLVRERLLLADGQVVPLGSRAMDLLIVLVERAGQVVSRAELIDRVWPHVAVEDNNLNVQVLALRKVLGSALISTRAGRGYCFTLAPRVSPAPGDDDDVPRLKTRLPVTLPAMFGRDREIAELAALAEAHRLVTLVGPGGVGKTLLAQHLLRGHEARFRHGVCIVELASLGDAQAVAGAIASALQIPTGAGVALAGLVHAMAPLEIMLVLDNAEHMVEGVARVVAALHNAVPGLRCVVTSQAPLKLSCERVYRLGPLSVPDRPLSAAEALGHGAIAMFVDRAQAADARFRLTDEASALAIDLCRALEGLPLAIELAAWRAPVVGVQGLVDALSDPLRLLAGSRTDVPRRLQTLRHALAWSHDLLAPREQTVLRRMSVLQGAAEIGLIEAIASDAPGGGPLDAAAVREAVATLVDRSLVSTVECARSRMRFRLLRVPCSFAGERLAEAGERDGVERRHAFELARHFERAYQQRYSADVRLNDWEERCLADIEDAQAALRWLRAHGETLAALKLLPGLILATPREQVDRHAALLATSLELAAAEPDGQPATWTLVEATYMVMTSDSTRRREVADLAVQAARRSVALFTDRRWLYRALSESAIIHLIDEQTDAGQACLVEARAMEDPAWPAVFRRHRWLAEVWLADRRGDGPGMHHCSLREFSLQRVTGHSGFASGVTLVNSALAAGHAEEAVHHGRLVQAQLEGTRHLSGLAEIRAVLMGALIACDRLREAGALSRITWPLVAHLGRKYEWAEFQALLLAREGRLQDAAVLLGYADMAYARANTSRTFNELNANRQTLELVRAGLPDRQVRHLMDKGRFLDKEDVPSIALRNPDGDGHVVDGAGSARVG